MFDIAVGAPKGGPILHRFTGSILRAGVNCAGVHRARRVAVLVDGAAYFQAVERALKQARRTIFIIGWDFDAEVVLTPQRDGRTLKQLLVELAQSRPELEIRILVWDFSVFYGPSTTPPYALFGEDWNAHPRIHVTFDSNHPLAGAHHQKIVCVDDALAFVGGIDLTDQRWDLPVHATTHPMRRGIEGDSYEPVHDVMMLVDGPAAAAVAEIARMRWLEGAGEAVPPACEAAETWPEGLPPNLRDVRIGVARTLPESNGRPAVREVRALNADALAAARHWIYIETQYFSAAAVGEILEARLQEPDGPDVVVVATYRTEGWLERIAMGSNRDRLIRRLRRADRFDRFRIYSPVVPGNPSRHVLVHSKVVMVDGRFLRIGSSNLNNRSMGLDSECDLAVEADTAEHAAAIEHLRNTLLAEHLGTSTTAVSAAVTAHGRLLPAVEALNNGPRCLQPFEVLDEAGPVEPFPGTALLDPEEPIDLRYLWDRLLSGMSADQPRR